MDAQKLYPIEPSLSLPECQGRGDQVRALSYKRTADCRHVPLTAFTYKLFFLMRDRSYIPPHVPLNRPSFSSTLAAPLHSTNDDQPPAANGTFRLQLLREGQQRAGDTYGVGTYVKHEPSLPATARADSRGPC